MLAMQYQFTLPADYDMGIIRRRIAAKGPLMDGFGGLGFKSFLFSERAGPEATGPENSYAPFYVWSDLQGMRHFLSGPGFEAVTTSFGWPSVRTWQVLGSLQGPSFHTATWASREILPVRPFTSLKALEDEERIAAEEDLSRHGALGAVYGYEPTTWTAVRFRHWPDRASIRCASGAQVYRVGHVAHGSPLPPEILR